MSQDVIIRYYGGWYNDHEMTRDAQKLYAEIDDDKIFFTGNKRCTMQLATSLIDLPSISFPSTYRLKSKVQNNLKVRSYDEIECQDNGCQTKVVVEYFSKKKCPVCRQSPYRVFQRNEQKLVDTMLSGDFLSISKRFPMKTIVLVSSDDDFWPVIRLSENWGSKVIHVFPKDRTSTIDFYSCGIGEKYQNILWSKSND
jgi:uncharacterized LabA/DUF88 family protein